jgi:hypothetical protein
MNRYQLSAESTYLHNGSGTTLKIREGETEATHNVMPKKRVREFQTITSLQAKDDADTQV